jgi:hypothetical protein
MSPKAFFSPVVGLRTQDSGLSIVLRAMQQHLDYRLGIDQPNDNALMLENHNIYSQETRNKQKQKQKEQNEQTCAQES